MIAVTEGQRYWKRGDQRHVWVVDAVVEGRDKRHYAVLVAEHGGAEEEVDLTHLRNRALYTPVPDDPSLVRED